jgi:hypothetical protein
LREADKSLGIFIFHPTVPNYPQAKFPGVVVFSEIYQGVCGFSFYECFSFLSHPYQILCLHHLDYGLAPFLPLMAARGTWGFLHSLRLLWSILTILIVTGPVARLARQIASQGYIVAAPSSYHEFTGPEALAYDGPGTDAGNEWKIAKTVEAYDEDATLSVDALLDMPTCNGRVGATGKHQSTDAFDIKN